jgi:hypothetical protein
MKTDLVKIETYKTVDLFYNKGNGRISFSFENRDLETKYVFEAQQIIDEPVWEPCDLKGYFVDGTFDDYIGKAIATRKNIKNGKPDWKYKRKYDMDYKYPNYGDGEKVYLLTDENHKVYEEFLIQKDKITLEEIKGKNIIGKLK